jgi:Domain of unknown function (DUF4406)
MMEKSRRLRIYVAGPYTAGDEQAIWANVVSALDAGIELYKRGHYPYVPHLTHFIEQRSIEMGAGLKWEDYLAWDKAWVEQCDAFLLLASSPGADMELGWARELGLRIFRSIKDVPVVPEPRAALVAESTSTVANRK